MNVKLHFIFPVILCSDCCKTSLLEKLYIHAEVVPSYTLTNAMLRYKSCIWIDANLPFFRLVILLHWEANREFQLDTPCWNTFSLGLVWNNQFTPLLNPAWFHIFCDCFQPLLVSTTAWQIAFMDFVEGLPRSTHANCFLVVIDSLTKYGHYVSLLYPFSAFTVSYV